MTRSFNNDLVIKKHDNYHNNFIDNHDNVTQGISQQSEVGNRDPARTGLANQVDEDHNSTITKNKKKEPHFILQKKNGVYAGLLGGRILVRWSQDHLIIPVLMRD